MDKQKSAWACTSESTKHINALGIDEMLSFGPGNICAFLIRNSIDFLIQSISCPQDSPQDELQLAIDVSTPGQHPDSFLPLETFVPEDTADAVKDSERLE
jgi:hypothetical protein